MITLVGIPYVLLIVYLIVKIISKREMALLGLIPIVSALTALLFPAKYNILNLNSNLTDSKEIVPVFLYIILILIFAFLSIVKINEIASIKGKRASKVISVVIYIVVLTFISNLSLQLNQSMYSEFLGIIATYIVVQIIAVILKYLVERKKQKKANALRKDKEKELAKQQKFENEALEIKNSLENKLINIDRVGLNDLWFTNTEAVNYLSKARQNVQDLLLLDIYKDKVGVFNNNISWNIDYQIDELLSYLRVCIENINKNLGILNLGIEGENAVNKVLDIHKYIINLPNLILKDENAQRVECDNLLITDKGIFILEVKNYGSAGHFTLKIDSTGRWTRVYNNKSYVMDSPFEQNSRHVGVIKNILFAHNVEVPVYGIVVIANDTVDIQNLSNNLVVRASSLMDVINNSNFPVLLGVDKREEIEKLLLRYKQEEVRHTFTNYDFILDNFETLRENLEQNKIYRMNIVDLYNEIIKEGMSTK